MNRPIARGFFVSAVWQSHGDALYQIGKAIDADGRNRHLLTA
jgi:hypothetical protein